MWKLSQVGGVVDIIASDKKYATIVIGTSTAGHTADQVDYLCDGVDDQVEIQSAIDSLTNGGEIKLLYGSYSISSNILMKSGIYLDGSYSSMVRTSNSVRFTFGGTVTNATITNFKKFF